MRGKKKQYIVIGLGGFGASVARTLFDLGNDVLAVDADGTLVDAVSQHVTQAVQANATDEGTLTELGIKDFDVAVVSIGHNTRDSILISLLCKELGVPYVVAKAVDDLHAKVLEKVGVDKVIFPERDMGLRVANSLVAPNVMELIALADGYKLVEVTLPEKWGNHAIGELDIRKRYGITIIGIHRNDQFLVSPLADAKLYPGDGLLVLGKAEDIAAIENK